MRWNPDASSARWRIVAWGALLIVAAGTANFAEEAVLLADQADGIIDAAGIARLEIVGIEGTLTLRAGAAGKLRFACRSLDKSREERPVSLWETDRAMRLSFSDQLEPQRLLLEVTLPPGLGATIQAHDSNLSINNVHGAVEVTGTDLVFGGRNLAGDLDLDIEGGSVTVLAGAGDIRLAGKDLETKLTQIQGRLEARLVGGRLHVQEMSGGFSLDLENTELVADGVGEADVHATGGTLLLNRMSAGGMFEVSGASLQVSASKGDIEVETDALVEFANLDGKLNVRSYGGGMIVSAATGQLLFEGSDGEVTLGQIGATASISGDRLTVQIDGISGDLTVNTTSSEVNVANAEGLVDVTNDFGDVNVAKASKLVKIVSRDGTVDVTNLEAPADVKADGPQVTVHWSGSSQDANSSVENASGDVRLLFSPKGGGRLEAVASSGRIESNIPGITVADDGTSAAGIVNRLGTPDIRVVSGGDIYLAGAAHSQPMTPTKALPTSRPVRPARTGN